MFYTTGCVPQNKSIKLAQIEPREDGGNPEVYNKKMNLCFSLTKSTKAQCLNTIYKNINILIIPMGNQPILLAGRGQGVERRTIEIKDDSRLIIYINTSNVKTPLKCNSKAIKTVLSESRVVFDIDVQSIVEYLQITDREGKLLLDYKIIK